jgi:hypothetical protein
MKTQLIITLILLVIVISFKWKSIVDMGNIIFEKSKNSKTISKPKTIDIERLIHSNNTNESIIELDKYICELCVWGSKTDKLSEQQKNFYYNQNLEREINNGGFSQYFFNSSGDFSQETINSLKLIGAHKTASILQKAIEQFPNKIVPKNRIVRQEIIEQIEENSNEIWEELDQKFFAYEDDLNSLNIEYVKQNKNKF